MVRSCPLCQSIILWIYWGRAPTNRDKLKSISSPLRSCDGKHFQFYKTQQLSPSSPSLEQRRNVQLDVGIHREAACCGLPSTGQGLFTHMLVKGWKRGTRSRSLVTMQKDRVYSNRSTSPLSPWSRQGPDSPFHLF